MTIYTRTEEGQLAAYSPGSVLPRKLRSLLKVIDGKTPVDVYNNSLKAFGDVEGVLTSLEMAGLIRSVAGMSPPVANVVSFDTAPAMPTMVWGETAQPQQQWAPASEAFAPVSQSFSHSVPREGRLQSTFPPGNMMEFAGQTARPEALGRAVDMMSNFVLTYAPEHSFMVLKELEDLTNLEQLAVTLGGYEMIVSHLGPIAREHLLLVKQILRDNL
jgi:hypothetical protein